MGTKTMQSDFVSFWKKENYTARLVSVGATQDEVNFTGMLTYNAFLLEGEDAAREVVETKIGMYAYDKMVPEEA